MAAVGGNKKKSGPSTKNAYKRYQLENRVHRNKLKRLTRHIKKHPEDKQTVESLVKIKKKGYIYNRPTPVNRGSNKELTKKELKDLYWKMLPGNRKQPKIRYKPRIIVLEDTSPVLTAGEQLSKLLGIPLPQKKKKFKAKITHKPSRKKNVKT